jgi:hypothetical protein
MSEPEDKLKKALAENGNFDAETAKRVAAEAGALLDRRLKWLARITWLRTLIVIAVGEVGFIGLFMTFSTKGMIGFAVLLLFAIVALCVIDLQYRITNTKVSLLKEIKLLRLEYLGRPTGQAAAPARETVSVTTNLWRTPPLSLREDAAWYVTLILVAAASALCMFRLMGGEGTLTHESEVKLSPDGSGTEVTKISYHYYGLSPMTSANIWSGVGPSKFTRWIDSRGRELPMNVSTNEKNKQYTVQLVEPVMPGDEVRETLFAESPKMAEKEGDLWIYRGRWEFGHEKNSYLETVQLPKGAEIVSVDPEPVQQSVQDALPTVRFQAIRSRNEIFTYTIQYRLPKASTHSKTTK